MMAARPALRIYAGGVGHHPIKRMQKIGHKRLELKFGRGLCSLRHNKIVAIFERLFQGRQSSAVGVCRPSCRI
jgi:hypothetical protein